MRIFCRGARAGLVAWMVLSSAAAQADSPHCTDVTGDGGLTTTDALAILRRAVGQDVDLVCPAPAFPVQTGQTSCYDAAGGTVSCLGSTQDGALGYGSYRGFVDRGNGTLQDGSTGLYWEKLSDDGGIHDADLANSWQVSLSGKVAELNSSAFAGFTDWRVPNRNELETLVHLGTSDPATWPAFDDNCEPGCTVLTCSCTRPLAHWTSTTVQGLPDQAWTVTFDDGYVDRDQKVSTFRPLRAVRGGH